MVQLAVELPNIGFFTWRWQIPVRLADYFARRRDALRAASLPRRFYLAVTATRVAALDVRFGAGVRIKRVLRIWTRSQVTARRSGASPLWIELTLPGADSVPVEPTDQHEGAELLAVLASA
jgi:hypothetical protein